MPGHKSRMEWHRKLKIDKKEGDDTGEPLPHLEVKATRVINAVIENQPYPRNGKA